MSISDTSLHNVFLTD